MKFRDCITSDEELSIYVDEEPLEESIKLNLSTNPLGFPEKAMDILKIIKPSDINHYNEPPELPEFKKALAKHSGIDESMIMLSTGADEAVGTVLTHILDPKDRVGIMVPTFPRFEITARRICDAEVINFKGLENVPEDCKCIVLCTPNNPSTEEIDFDKVVKVIKNNKDSMIVLDNVFYAFGKNNFSRLLDKYDNLIILKSLSKSFGLPGLRIGWIESQEKNIKMLHRGIPVFRVSYIAQRFGLQCLKHPEHVKESIEYMDKEFAKIKNAFGDRVIRKSNVPFYMFKVKDSQKTKKWLLEEKNIAVVDSVSFKGSDFEFLRITIGKEDENEALIKAMKDYKE